MASFKSTGIATVAIYSKMNRTLIDLIGRFDTKFTGNAFVGRGTKALVFKFFHGQIWNNGNSNMKHVLVKYKNIKLLVNEGCDMQPMLEQLQSIEALTEKVNDLYINLVNATPEQFSDLEKERQQLISKIGYKIIGVPFTNQDAELYALDKKMEYKELVLSKEMHADIEYERINIDVEKPLKTLAVRHVNNSSHKNLAAYIEYLIKKDLGI